MKKIYLISILAMLLVLIMPAHATPSLVNYLLVNNGGFENTSCPQTQDLVTCGWWTNTQDCTFLSTCSIVTSASAPEKSHYFHAIGAVGQGQQNNDMLGNVSVTAPSSTPALEVFVRWNGITSCQGVGHSCLFKLAFVFNANTKLVNYYWANNFTIFSSLFINSSSAVFYPMNGVCGSLVVSANFCDFTDSSFMSRAQAYYSNTLTSYGFGQGSASFANHPVFYSIDMSYGCFVISPAVCNAANWNVDVDYIAAGNQNTPFQTTTNQSASFLPAVFVIMLGGIVIAVSKSPTDGETKLKLSIGAAIGLGIIFLALVATGL